VKILNVIFPVAVNDLSRYRTTIDYYRRVLGLPILAEFQHDGMSVSSLGPMVIVGGENASSLKIARQVNAIFVVDDLQEAWGQLRLESEILVRPESAPSGGRFVVRHTQGDKRVVEYLDLRNVERKPT
jgi:hypothetical protein